MNSTLAVVVTYNRLEMLKSGIDHLLAQTAPCDILVVDNASTDGTGEWIMQFSKTLAKEQVPTQTSHFKKILYENTGANLGGAGGFNYGLRRACELGYTYAWIMDDDAFAESDCLEKLLLAAKSLSTATGPSSVPSSVPPSVPSSIPFGFLSSIVLWKDGSLCKMNWQRKLHLPRKRSEHHITENDINKEEGEMIPIQSATFVSLLFPTSVIYRVGLPIRDFFIWCDDIEFTRRISLKHQLPCYAVTDSRIVHHIANNVGTDLATDSKERIPRYNYAFRNENYMYRQYGLKGFCYYILVCLYNGFKVITKAPDSRGQRLWVIVRNFFSGLKFNPKVEYLSRLPEKPSTETR